MQITKYLSTLKKNNRILILFLFVVILSACKVDVNYSIIPEIHTPSYTLEKDHLGKDSVVILQFSFKDGDGDIGLEEKDSVPPNNKNVFVDYFEKESDGIFRKQLVPFTKDTLNFNSRISFRTPPSAGPLQGEVKLKVDIFYGNRDTILFSYYIKDRAFQKSNVLTTEIIILDR